MFLSDAKICLLVLRIENGKKIIFLRNMKSLKSFSRKLQQLMRVTLANFALRSDHSHPVTETALSL